MIPRRMFNNYVDAITSALTEKMIEAVANGTDPADLISNMVETEVTQFSGESDYDALVNDNSLDIEEEMALLDELA